MSTIEIIGIVMGTVMAYCAIGGVTWAVSSSMSDPDGRVFCSVIWPLALPAILGSALVKWIQAPRAAKDAEDAWLPRVRVVNRSEDD